MAAVLYAAGGLIAATGIGQPTFDLRNLISGGQEFTFDFITGLIFDDFEAAAFELWASANPGLPVEGAARIDKLFIHEGKGFPPRKAQPFIAGTEQLTVAFIGEFEGDIAPFPPGFAWDFGDGTSVEQNPVHTYAEPGRYSATLTVSSGFEQATTEIVVPVPSRPLPIPTANSTGLVLLSSLLALGGLLFLRRRLA